MNRKEELIHQLRENYKSSFENKGGLSFRSENYILTGIIEKELVNSKKLNGTEKAGLLEELLRERCQYRGFENQEEIDNYIEAVSNGDSNERQRILLKAAEKFEKAERLVYAAEEYFEAGKFKKAAEVLVKSGHQDLYSGEFLMAAYCLVKAGVKKEKAYSKMSEEIRKMITIKKEKYGRSLARDYYNLGECLHNAGKREDALRAFMDAELEKYDKLQVGKNYLASIGEFERAAKFQKKLIEEENLRPRDCYLELAEYYNKAGLKREEADALWKARNFLEAARIAFEITKNKEVFLKAAGAYRSIRPERQSRFVDNIWGWFGRSCQNMYDYFRDKSIKESGEERLDKIHDLLVSFCSAYSLPIPQKISYEVKETVKSHKEIADKLYKEFQEKRRSAKGVQLKNLLSDSSLVKAIEYAVLGGFYVYEVEDIFERAFKGFSCPRPFESKLTSEVKKLWQEAGEWEIRWIGYNPIEMAARAYEEGGYYKEARERYLKASLQDDARRMEKLIKNQVKLKNK